MDTTSRRPHLPAISYLDVEKGGSEGETYQDQDVGSSETSPSYPRSTGQPQAYSHSTSHTSTWSAAPSDGYASSGSRRTSGESHDNPKPMARQSLPSISEALGVDTQTPYSMPPAQPSSQTVTPSSPTPNFSRRSYGLDGPSTRDSYASQPSYTHSSFRQDSAGPQSYPHSEHLRSGPLESRTPAPLPPSHPARPERLEKYGTHYDHEPPSSQTHSSMGPPTVPYGYASYQARHAEPAPSGHSSGPIYQPSSQHGPPSGPAPAWRSESAGRYGSEDRNSQSATYGESVKRHLDLYDMEAALNDISQSSGIVMDFSRRYGDRMHQLARSTPSLSTLPSIVEVDDMMSKSRLQLDSLGKIRDVIITQQITYDQQLAEQRHQAKSFREAPLPQAVDSFSDAEDSKGGFAGSEPKKRRGRAAPPGRCHSCNRAETPEWRRGPDGARTLCNACGLHYAKLTRKQTNANKAPTPSSSNLRPKEA